MSHGARSLSLLVFIFLNSVHVVKGDICPDGLCAENVPTAFRKAAEPAPHEEERAKVALMQVDSKAPSSNSEGNLRSSPSRTRLQKTESNDVQSTRSALKLEAEDGSAPSAKGAWAPPSGVDKLFNTSLLKVGGEASHFDAQVRSTVESVAASARWPRVFSQVPASMHASMHTGTRQSSWLGSMAMIFVVSGVIIFMVLLLFAFQEKVKQEKEQEPVPPPLQFLRNSQTSEAYPQKPTMQVPRGPASTSSVVSHMRDPRFASGAEHNPAAVREGSGAPWA